MTVPKSPTPVKEGKTAPTDAWEEFGKSWDAGKQEQEESPVVESPDPRVDFAERDARRTEERFDDPGPAPARQPTHAVNELAERAWETKAPAVVELTLDSADPSAASAMTRGYVGVDEFASSPEHYAPRASAVLAFRDRDRWLLQERRPGRNSSWEATPTVFREPDARSQLSRYVAELHSAVDTAALPLLVVIDEADSDRRWAERLARDADALVVLLEHRSGIEQPIFKAKTLKPAVKAVIDEPTAEPEPVQPTGEPIDAAWFDSKVFRSQLAGWPEQIEGPNGLRLAVAWPRRSVAVCRGWVEVAGHLQEVEVKLADGTSTPLSEIEWQV